MDTSSIRERMEVHAGGQRIGIVDRVQGDRIELTRDHSPDGRRHTIPLDWVRGIEGNAVTLGRNAEGVMAEWGDDSPVGVDSMLEDTFGTGSGQSMGGSDLGGRSMGGTDMGSAIESSSGDREPSMEDDLDDEDEERPRI